jgi:hypothetical protein
MHIERAEPSDQGSPPPGVLIGYARCSTDKQDLAAQRKTLRELGVSDDRVYLDHGMTAPNFCRVAFQVSNDIPFPPRYATWRAYVLTLNFGIKHPASSIP